MNRKETVFMSLEAGRIIVNQQAVGHPSSGIIDQSAVIIQPCRASSVQPCRIDASDGFHHSRKLAEVCLSGGSDKHELIGGSDPDSGANARGEMHSAAEALIAGIDGQFAIFEQARPGREHGLIVSPVISARVDEFDGV